MDRRAERGKYHISADPIGQNWGMYIEAREFRVAPRSKDRVDHIFENYLLALASVDQCSANAADALKNRLAANLDRAERIYADAAADGLIEASRQMEADLVALSLANERARDRLHDGAPIADLLEDLEEGTDYANRVLRQALSRQARG